MFNFSKLKNQDLILVGLIGVLSLLGLINVYATTFFVSLDTSVDFQQQLLFFAAGIILYLLISCLDSSFLSQTKIQYILLAGAIGMLVLLLIINRESLSPARWINIGPVALQPSEFIKLIIITSTATLFASRNEITLATPLDIYKKVRTHRWRVVLMDPLLREFIVHALAIATIVLLILRQPSLGNALITLGLWLLMLTSLIKRPWAIYAYIVLGGVTLLSNQQLFGLEGLYSSLGLVYSVFGINLIVLLGILLLALLAIRTLRLNFLLTLGVVVVALIASLSAGIVWNNVLTEYQKDRVEAFFNPESDPLGSQWQVNQAKIAIGSGQLFGKGLLNGTQSNSGLLPFAYTDFAYAAFTEQFGMVGAAILLLLLYLLILRIFHLSEQIPSNFGRLICIGVAIMISLNTIVNIGMNLGLMPVTGVPLPLISYGGSAVVVNLLGLGLVQMVYSNQNEQIETTKLLDIKPTK